eukprot:s166_g18.t1
MQGICVSWQLAGAIRCIHDFLGIARRWDKSQVDDDLPCLHAPLEPNMAVTRRGQLALPQSWRPRQPVGAKRNLQMADGSRLLVIQLGKLPSIPWSVPCWLLSYPGRRNFWSTRCCTMILRFLRKAAEAPVCPRLDTPSLPPNDFPLQMSSGPLAAA